MVIFTKKFGQFKQWTGEKFGSTDKTQKPAEIKQLQNETKSRFDGIENIRNSLNSYMKSLDETRNSSLGELAQALSSQSQFHESNEFGTLLATFGDGISKLSTHQNNFADEIRMGLLMAIDALLNETNEFEKLRKKLKNRRLDYDANNNKLQKNRKEDPALEENVKTTKFKYEETLQKLEVMMISVSKQESELIDPFINFMEFQIKFYNNCLMTSESIIRILKESKINLKSIDFVTESFRKELEEDEFWINSGDNSEEKSKPDHIILTEKETKKDGNKEFKQMNVISNYDFIAENGNEMSLKKGDIITVTKCIDEGWWVGICKGKTGMFPSNYVTIIENDKNEIESREIKIQKLKKEIQENDNQFASNPGFSYLPQGTPITFINRNGGQIKSSNQQEIEITTSCTQCNCEEFSANVFKAGHCNNCFHKH